MIGSNVLRANQRAAKRQLHTTAGNATKAGLNRYSKIITQPKSQGASQVGAAGSIQGQGSHTGHALRHRGH